MSWVGWNEIKYYIFRNRIYQNLVGVFLFSRSYPSFVRPSFHPFDSYVSTCFHFVSLGSRLPSSSQPCPWETWFLERNLSLWILFYIFSVSVLRPLFPIIAYYRPPSYCVLLWTQKYLFKGILHFTHLLASQSWSWSSFIAEFIVVFYGLNVVLTMNFIIVSFVVFGWFFMRFSFRSRLCGYISCNLMFWLEISIASILHPKFSLKLKRKPIKNTFWNKNFRPKQNKWQKGIQKVVHSLRTTNYFHENERNEYEIIKNALPCMAVVWWWKVMIMTTMMKKRRAKRAMIFHCKFYSRNTSIQNNCIRLLS